MFRATKRAYAGGSELQDCAEIFSKGESLILILADGAGGMSGAAEAARFVVRRLSELVFPDSISTSKLPDLLRSVDLEMVSHNAAGESTCVVTILTSKKIVGASIGDSGAWMLSENGVENLTAYQCRKPLLGSGLAVPVAFERERLEGTLLLASDGLLKYASQQKIVSAIAGTDMELAADRLMESVRFPSGAFPDDVSYILVRNE